MSQNDDFGQDEDVAEGYGAAQDSSHGESGQGGFGGQQTNESQSAGGFGAEPAPDDADSLGDGLSDESGADADDLDGSTGPDQGESDGAFAGQAGSDGQSDAGQGYRADNSDQGGALSDEEFGDYEDQGQGEAGPDIS
jgi:hypothetical protein